MYVASRGILQNVLHRVLPVPVAAVVVSLVSSLVPRLNKSIASKACVTVELSAVAGTHVHRRTVNGAKRG